MNEKQQLALQHPINGTDAAGQQALAARSTITTTGGVSLMVILAVDR